MSFDLKTSEAQFWIPEISVVKKLKGGGQKVAFVADRGSDRYALKIYDPAQIDERVYREAHAMLTIQSPYVIRLEEFHYKATPSGVFVYLLEELVDGDDMSDILERGKIFSPKEAVTLLDQLLEGLEACWVNHIVHRDIKPGNIMIRKNGDALIIDFGIARHLDLETITDGHPYLGPRTIKFGAPEVLQVDRKKEIDNKSDLFSLGITAYMMLTGKHPLWDDRADFTTNHMNMIYGDALPLSQVNPKIPKPLSDFVLKLMNKDRFHRPVDATDARERLQRIALS